MFALRREEKERGPLGKLEKCRLFVSTIIGNRMISRKKTSAVGNKTQCTMRIYEVIKIHFSMHSTLYTVLNAQCTSCNNDAVKCDASHENLQTTIKKPF